MTARVLAAALLAASLAVAPNSAAASPNTTAPSPTPAPFVDCPIVRVPPQPAAPPPSPLPKHQTDLPTLGGDGLASAGLVVSAGSPALPGNLSATSWIVADMDSGAVVGACGAHEYGAPASLQKLLLALTVLPKLEPATVATVTAEDMNFEPGSSAVGLLLDGQYTVETLWLGLLLNSGNDTANVLARLGGGADGVAGTMRAMNAEARRIGALDTHAETPHGLDGPGQVTSAYDLALITRALFDREDFTRYVATKSAAIPAQPHVNRPDREKAGFQIQNENRLLAQYPGALGGKTGFTDIARHTFVGAAQRDGRRLVVALLGAEHQPARTWQQAAALLDWGFANPASASVGHLVEPGEAERLFAAASPTPSPGPAAPIGAAAAITASSPLLLGAVALIAAFAGVWFIVLLVWLRRRMVRRQAASGVGGLGD